MKQNLIRLLFIIFLISSLKTFAGYPPGLAKADSAWVDSVMNSLSLEQKIAQLMIIRVSSNRDSVYEDSLISLIRTYNPGGVCFFKGTPYREARLTNKLQKNSPTPLYISIDAEWGLSMRLDSTPVFPRQMTLGAISDNTLIYDMASAIARECKRIGVNFNFAPVVDVNNNPGNPVIGSRSFGESVFNVTGKGLAYMAGLQDNGILSTAKHFPGHGDTDTDSHLGLPVIPFDSARLDSMELFPFRELIRRGLGGIMNAHLYVPNLDSAKLPSTLSKKIVTNLLRKKLGFSGLAVTDALDMKGVTQAFPPGKIELEALIAGNDILLLPQHVSVAIKVICEAVDSGYITMEEINEKCRKVLAVKSSIGLKNLTPVKLDSLYQDLNPASDLVLKKKLYQNAVTIVKNDNNLVPLNFLEYRKIAVISAGDTQPTIFQETCGKFADVVNENIPINFTDQMKDSLMKQISESNLVIIGIHANTFLASKRFGIPLPLQKLIDSISMKKRVILDIFGTPYSLALFDNTAGFETILISYQNDPDCQQLSAEAIFGGIDAKGRLPVTGSREFPLNTGITTEKNRFEYIMPEEAGIASSELQKIDTIAIEGINKGAYPGCQIIFAKNGRVFYQKSFGYSDYTKENPVENEDIYDIASVTKMAATTLAVMKLHDDGKISPDSTLGKYLPMVTGSNKEKLTIRDIMAHQAGLQPWIPFFEKTIRDRKLLPGIYDTVQSEGYPVKVAERMFIRKDYRDSVFRWIIDSPLRGVKDYKYSDLGFYLLAKVVEQVTGQEFSSYLDSTFYKPLGLKTMGFKPLEHFASSQIMPTEDDQIFRKQILRGNVHDPGAAMLGGVAGHAGLFSDAADLAVILQMLINGGEYGGRQYLLPSTVKEFTSVQFPQNNNRRGMGFDKPMLQPAPDGPVCISASPKSFGHSGFTGTYVWADPDNGLIYVFLSNRVNPDASNQKLADLNIRTRIHQTMYDILNKNQTK